jgi:hypothetical protein
MSGTSCCGAMAGSCFCGVNPEDSPGYVPSGFTREEWESADREGLSDEIKAVLEHYGAFSDEPPLSPERKAALAHIGFDEVGSIDDLTDEDAVQVLAFHKFLESGEWKELPADQTVCRNCGQPVYADVSSGFWMHSSPYADKVNGYYCYEGCWTGTVPLSNAVPDDATRKIFQVDQASFDYATGKISASEYLESDLGSVKEEDRGKNEAS